MVLNRDYSLPDPDIQELQTTPEVLPAAVRVGGERCRGSDQAEEESHNRQRDGTEKHPLTGKVLTVQKERSQNCELTDKG